MDLFEIGQAIEKARKERGLTQRELGQLADLSDRTVRDLERGVIGDVGIRKVQRLLEHLGLALATQPVGRQRPTLDDLAAERQHGARSAPRFRG